MRMLLTSNGVQGEPLLSTLTGLLEKPIAESRTVMVIDAMLPFPGDKGRMLEHLQQYRSLGWAECDMLTLTSGPRSGIEARLRNADAIYCYGGTNHWLAHMWRESGLAPLLRELLDEKVYIGLSAGSMIFSRLHEAAVEALDDQEEVDMLELETVGPALPLFDWFPLTHFGADFFPHMTDEWAAEVAPRFGGSIYLIPDGSALLVRDVGSEPEVVSDGHWLHLDASGAVIGSDRA